MIFSRQSMSRLLRRVVRRGQKHCKKNVKRGDSAGPDAVQGRLAPRAARCYQWHVKIGVSTYSFQKLIDSGERDLPAVIRQARAMGFQGIEFYQGSFPKGEKDLVSYAARMKDVCAAEGLPVLAYAVSADFLKPKRGSGWQDEAQRLNEDLAVAASLGAPCMRHDATWGSEKPFEEVLPVLAQGCRAVAEKAQGLGIRTTVENHGYFVQESRRCARLMETVHHPNFGALVDVGNFLCADEDPVEAVTRMAPFAAHCHVKDFHAKPAKAADPGKGWFRSRDGAFLRGAILGHGVVDIPGCLRAMRAGGYDGWVSIEFEGLEDCILALQIGLENLKRYGAA
jgi:sugar phosphate isomerase/epimerase